MLNKSGLILLISALLAVLLLAAGACISSTNGTTTSTTPTTSTSSAVSFSQDIQPIFNSNCVVCHQGMMAPQGLSLEAGMSYQELVNAGSTQSSLALIAPGNVEQSYLWHKVNGTQASVGGSGARMPYQSAALPASQLSLIRQWIEQGAMNN